MQCHWRQQAAAARGPLQRSAFMLVRAAFGANSAGVDPPAMALLRPQLAALLLQALLVGLGESRRRTPALT